VALILHHCFDFIAERRLIFQATLTLLTPDGFGLTHFTMLMMTAFADGAAVI
jgi:hypothetical protein